MSASYSPPLDSDRILPITIKAPPNIVDLLEELIDLFPRRVNPDQMARIVEQSDEVSEMSNAIKTKVYCVLSGKTALGNIRMMFLTNNFEEMRIFLDNGNTWKRETSFRNGLLYMLRNQSIQGSALYAPITPPRPSSSSSASYRSKFSVPPTPDSRQSTPATASSSTPAPMPQSSSRSNGSSTGASAKTPRKPHCRTCGKPMKGHANIVCFCQLCGQPKLFHNLDLCKPQPQASTSGTWSVSKGKGRERSQTSESETSQSTSKGKGRERSQTSDFSSEANLEERVSRLEERLDAFEFDI